MQLPNKSLPPCPEPKLQRNECIRHGITYYGYNCSKCKQEGTLIFEFVQYVLPKSAKPVGGFVP